MKIKKAFTASVATLLSASTIVSSLPVYAEQQPNEKPNIVLILLDDTGAREFSCYGNTYNETPYIDSVAAAGQQYMHFYTQPVCSPSRSCLMTGCNTLRTGITNFLQASDPVALDPNEFTALPTVMNANGYHTGIIGKWHLCAGNQYNTSIGSVMNYDWDETIFCEQKSIGYGDYFYPYTHIPQAASQSSTKLSEGDFLVDTMYDQALDYIRRNQNEPFFLFLSHYATHIDLAAPQETVDYFQEKRGSAAKYDVKGNNPYLAAMLKHIDDGVAKIDSLLDKLGLKENTILIIASDNGGETRVTSNGELRGGKRQIYEGGITSPLIIRWPKKMSKSAVIDTPVSIIDFYSTFAEAGGMSAIEIPENEGTSLMPLITESGDLDRDVLYWVYPRNTDYNPGDDFTNAELTEGGAIRNGNYKYLESFAFPERRELYNLVNDPSESNNIISDNPELYMKLSRQLHEELEKDTIGKKFVGTFATGENYRYHSRGTISRSNGQYIASGDGISIVTTEDFLFYDSVTEVELSISDTGRAGVILRSNLAAPTNKAYTSYAVTLSPSTGLVEVLNVHYDCVIPIASTNTNIQANTVYKLKVITDSYNIKVYVNDMLVLETEDETYFKGSLGLFSENSNSLFDNLTVTGFKGENPITDRQLGYKPDDSILISYNNLYVWFDNSPKEICGDVYVQADKIIDALGGKYIFNDDTGELSASFFGFKMNVKAGDNNALFNGISLKLANAPYIKKGKLMIDIDILAGGLGFSIDRKGNELSLFVNEKNVYSASDSAVGHSEFFTKDNGNLYSLAAGSKTVFSFGGTSVKVFMNLSPDSGMYKVYLDGELVVMADGYSSIEKTVLTYESSRLNTATHTLVIENVGKNGIGSGTKVSIARFEAKQHDYKLSTGSGETSEFIYNTDKRITYSGNWNLIDNPAAYDGSVTRSSVAGDECELSFIGHGIKLFLGRGTSSAKIDVLIDGVLVENKLNAYSLTGIQKSLIFEKNDLTEGVHSIKVVNTGIAGNSNGKGINLNIDAFEVLSSSASEQSEMYFDDDSKFIFTGNWSKVNVAGAFNGTVHRTSTSNAICELSFIGHGIDVFLAKGPNCGITDIYIDGTKVAEFDGYNSFMIQKINAYSSMCLGDGTHTLRIVNTGIKGSSESGGINTNIDAVKVYYIESSSNDSTVDAVINVINTLPSQHELVAEHIYAINAANEIYGTLNETQRALVINLSTLYALTEQISQLVSEVILGDANGDGKVDDNDIVLLKNYLANLGENTYTSVKSNGSQLVVKLGADINRDGAINGKDLLQYLK